MAIEIGTVRGRIQLVDNFTSELNRAASDLEKFGKRMQRSGRQMSDIGGQLTRTLTLPMVAVGAAAVKMATDLNEGMANVATLIPGNTARVAELRNEIQGLAVDLGKSTTDLSEGLYQTISAFGDTAETVKVLEINARSATAGLSTTLEAIDLTSAVTKGYGDTSAEAVQKAADLALMTVRLGQTTFPELAASMGRVIPLAEAVGQSQEDMFAVFATATGVVGRASEVATQYRGVINALLKPTDDLSKLIAAQGFASGEAMLRSLGLVDTLELIGNTAKSTGKPITDYIAQIEAVPLALALAGPQADVFRGKLRQMGDAAGATSAAFREQTEGVNAAGFAWKQMRIEIVVALQKLGQELLPIATTLLGVLRPVVSALEGMASALAAMPKPVQVAVVGLAGLVAAAGPALFIAGQMTIAYGTLITTFPKVAAAFALAGKGIAASAAALTGPAGWIAAGVALLLLIKPIREAVFDLGGRALSALREGVSTVVGKLREWWQESAEVRRVLGMVARQLVADLGTALRVVGGALQGAWEWTVKVARAMADAFVRGMEMLGILRALKAAWDAVADATKRAVGWLERVSGLEGKEGFAKLLIVLNMINPAFAQAAAGAAAYTARAVELQSQQDRMVKVASEVVGETENIILTTGEMDRALRKAAGGGGGVAALSEEAQKLADRWRLAIEQSEQLVAAIEQGGRPAFEALERQFKAANEVTAAGVKLNSDLGREMVALGVAAEQAAENVDRAVGKMDERLKELIGTLETLSAAEVALEIEGLRIAQIQAEVDVILNRQSLRQTLKDINRALSENTDESSAEFRKGWVAAWLEAAKKRKEIEEAAALHARQVNVNLTNDMLSIWGSALQQLASDAADTADIMEQVFKQMLVAVGTAMAGPIGGIIGGILGSVIFKPSNDFDSASSLGGNWRNFFGADFAGLQADMERALDAILAVIDGFVEQLPEIAITVSEQEDRFRLQIAGVFVGVFDSFEEALHIGLREALEGAVLVGVAPEILTALANSTARSLEEMVAQLELAQHIADLRVGAGQLAAELRVLYREFLANADAARRLGLETAGLTGEFVGRLGDIRDDILGITRDEFEQRKQDADDFNRFIQTELEKAAAELDRLLGAYARYQQVAELIGRGQRILADFGFKTAEEMLARILELQNLLASLPDLLIDPAAIPRGRGGRGPSPKQQDMDSVRDLLDQAARQLLPEFARAMAEINLKWDEALVKTHGNAALIAEVTAMREAEIAALRQQVQGDAYQSFYDAIAAAQGLSEIFGVTDAFRDLRQQIVDAGLGAEETARLLAGIDWAEGVELQQIEIGIVDKLFGYLKDSADFAAQSVDFARMKVELEFGIMRAQLQLLGVFEKYAEIFDAALAAALEQASVMPDLVPPTTQIRDNFNDARDAAKEMADRLLRAKEGIADLLVSMDQGEFGGVSPQEALANAVAQFRSVRDAARTGAIGAVEQFPSVAQDLLRIAREFGASGPQFQALFDEVRASGVDLLGLTSAREGNVVFDQRFFAQQETQTDVLSRGFEANSEEQARMRRELEALRAEIVAMRQAFEAAEAAAARAA